MTQWTQQEIDNLVGIDENGEIDPAILAEIISDALLFDPDFYFLLVAVEV